MVEKRIKPKFTEFLLEKDHFFPFFDRIGRFHFVFFPSYHFIFCLRKHFKWSYFFSDKANLFSTNREKYKRKASRLYFKKLRSRKIRWFRRFYMPDLRLRIFKRMLPAGPSFVTPHYKYDRIFLYEFLSKSLNFQNIWFFYKKCFFNFNFNFLYFQNVKNLYLFYPYIYIQRKFFLN